VGILAGDGNIIGAPGAGNVISGNTGIGLDLGNVSNDLVQGNFIGTDLGGTIQLGNNGTSPNQDGILITGGGNNTIGGTAAGEGNTIAFNTGPGVQVGQSAGDATTGNSIRGNAIYQNTGNRHRPGRQHVCQQRFRRPCGTQPIPELPGPDQRLNQQ